MAMIRKVDILVGEPTRGGWRIVATDTDPRIQAPYLEKKPVVRKAAAEFVRGVPCVPRARNQDGCVRPRKEVKKGRKATNEWRSKEPNAY